MLNTIINDLLKTKTGFDYIRSFASKFDSFDDVLTYAHNQLTACANYAKYDHVTCYTWVNQYGELEEDYDLITSPITIATTVGHMSEEQAYRSELLKEMRLRIQSVFFPPIPAHIVNNDVIDDDYELPF